jgi:hypothetical protein
VEEVSTILRRISSPCSLAGGEAVEDDLAHRRVKISYTASRLHSTICTTVKLFVSLYLVTSLVLIARGVAAKRAQRSRARIAMDVVCGFSFAKLARAWFSRCRVSVPLAKVRARLWTRETNANRARAVRSTRTVKSWRWPSRRA